MKEKSVFTLGLLALSVIPLMPPVVDGGPAGGREEEGGREGGRDVRRQALPAWLSVSSLHSTELYLAKTLQNLAKTK